MVALRLIIILKQQQQQQCAQELHCFYKNLIYNDSAISSLSIRKCQNLGLWICYVPIWCVICAHTAKLHKVLFRVTSEPEQEKSQQSDKTGSQQNDTGTKMSPSAVIMENQDISSQG